MANERTKIDVNQEHTIAGVTYDANEDIMNLTTNPVDKRLRVDASITDVGDGATSANQTNGSQLTKIQETEPTDASKINSSMEITEVTVGTVTTKTLVKTIGSTQYQKTIATDSSNNSISISQWSAI